MFLDQKMGMNTGFTAKGLDILEYLLEIGKYQDTKKRILVDIKHLSVAARKEFYIRINEHLKINPEDNIPIIASHTAYSGLKNFDEFLNKDESFENFENSKNNFNSASLNLCDQDIMQIYNSKGIIGLNLDQRILSSSEFINSSKKLGNDLDKVLPFWANHIVNHITQMADVIFSKNKGQDAKRVWDMFCIGSDFDGFINPVDAFITTEDFDDLDYHLMVELNKNDIFKKYNFGMSAEKIARKIMFENAVEFARIHYFSSKDIPVGAA
jgi:microsomal dipeptidase-like Zn-dependent dipeptidase